VRKQQLPAAQLLVLQDAPPARMRVSCVVWSVSVSALSSIVPQMDDVFTSESQMESTRPDADAELNYALRLVAQACQVLHCHAPCKHTFDHWQSFTLPSRRSPSVTHFVPFTEKG
jgi:hypothetical protein